MEKIYKPVSCNLYDKLTEAAVTRKPVYIKTEQEETVSEVMVKDIITKNHEEFLVTTDGKTLRLDTITLME